MTTIYSDEIKDYIEKRNHLLDDGEYKYVSDMKESPQLKNGRIKYSPYGDNFELWTDDGLYITFKVKLKEKSED